VYVIKERNKIIAGQASIEARLAKRSESSAVPLLSEVKMQMPDPSQVESNQMFMYRHVKYKSALIALDNSL